MERKEATHSEDPLYGASSSSTSKGNDHEVFLSFRGIDTRKGLTDYLYTSLVDAGIRVFRDNNELGVGEEIDPNLHWIITQSKISIPIISENYAFSKWCLHELAFMLECKRSIGQIVLPIFYKVEPSELRHLTGRFKDAINAHNKNSDDMVLEEWKEALKEVSTLKGWESEKIENGHEGILVKMVVKKVISQLTKRSNVTVLAHLVGIDERVEHIMSLIDTKFDGTSIVGIYGMGGIGKTVLARVLYNKLSSHFENLSYLANIRETSQLKGIQCLQKQLISDILRSSFDFSNVEEGINIIRSRFAQKKVLILFDDMDDITQLDALCVDNNWFKAGSIIIITTRNKSILDKARAGYMYLLNELPLDKSLVLFSRYAFQMDYPKTSYEDISHEIVLTIGGLPLALEVIGSFLSGKREAVWIETLKKLRKVPDRKVQETLKISYEALEYEEQQIFLDVACFFTGSSKQSPTYMWDSCDFFPMSGIEVLSLMSLIEVDKDGKLMMHDEIRDLGREIVRLENPMNPQERSRLWNHEDAECVLVNNEGTRKIEGLRLDKYGCRSYKAEQFKELIGLRFLQVNGANFSGDFQDLLPQLRWLQWQACPSDFTAANFHPKKLVVLNLSWSEISEDWGGWGPLEMAIELRVLNLSHCHSLRRTPDLFTFERLEILILKDCDNLEEIHPSIGNIKTLVSLNVKRCCRLKELPAGVGKMKGLRELLLDETAIQDIPISSGGLRKLETLCASFCGQLSQLSNAMDFLASLTQLDLSHLRIKELPEIGSLKELKTLDASYCALLTRIPNSIGSLESLQRLLLQECCSLREIPNSIGNLTLLTKLDLKFTAIIKLPSSIGNLQNLRILDICGTPVCELPSTIGMMTELQELRASCCKNLEGLPSAIGELFLLNNLDLDMSGISGLPKTLSELSSLQNLSVQYCKNLGELPQLPSRLTSLDITGRMLQLPHLSQLFYLKKLTLSDCLSLICLPQLPIGLLTLSITRCGKLKELTNLSNLEYLTTLILNECFELEVTGLEGLPHLSKLHVQRCPKIPRLDGLESLRCLHINKSIEKMKDEAIQLTADMETSDGNYAIAAFQNVVGIDDRVKQITDLLEMEVNDEVRIIGVCGTDGIGKTTSARAVYDRISSCFDSRSFLAEVEETTQSHGIQFLQNKLILDILERDREDPSFDERIEDFLDIFREMKVLIVVDDVEKPSNLHAIVGDQLHWFGPGSRIIVTSKNSGILKEFDSDKAPTYMVSELDDGQAFESFCKHVFRMQSSIPDYDGLSNRIVNATGKLPLAVEVVGSFLRGKSIQEWKKMEKSMKERMMSSQKTTVGLEEILDICYKELDQQQKDIFLDIACFVPGVDARIASYMWPNCYPSSGCILMPLAKIGENNELQMHGLLRRLGKRIFKQEESQDPSPGRFCTQDMVLKAMNREKGIKNVDAHDSCMLKGASFPSMPAISYLKLDDAKVSGDFAGAFPRLRWLCWQRCPLEFDATNFVLRELVILDLSWSKVTEEWGGWTEIKMEKLKVLNLTGCSYLLFTPDFSNYKDLEILILERCSRLVKLDPSIGHLKHLVSLNLKFCSQLNGLPVELGRTTALKELFIEGTSVRQIPISIGNLKQLEILSGLKCFPLTHLPSSICYLTALSKLSLEGAKISELPRSLGKLLKLRRLLLRDCRCLEILPYSIGEMGSLEELDISATSISELPDSIRNLKSLKVLRMDSSFIRAFPREIGNLTMLEELHASWCWSLKGAIPCDIEGLHRLRSLTLGHSSISSLPPEISTISGLHTLDLIQCDEIEELPKLPSSLICLRVSSKRMKAIPLLEDIKELEELCLSDGDPKARRPPSKLPVPESNVKRMIDKQSFSIQFPKLRKLELSLSQVVKLKFGLTDIPPLKRLKTVNIPGLTRRDVSELPKTLSVFKLYHSAIEEIEGLEGLEALKRLDISNCKIQNLNGIGQITSLRSLILSDCDDLSLPDLSNLKSLKVLEIRRCKMIGQIEGLEKLTSLEKLNISECPAEESAQVQDALKRVMARSPDT